MKNTTQLKGALLLLLTALVWGVAFTAQSKGMESVEAFTFNGIRMLMGSAVLAPFVILRDKLTCKKLTETQKAEKKRADKRALLHGALLGIVFFTASNIQQHAFLYTGSGKIAFITALYIFFVPMLGLFIKKRTPLLTWLCVVLGFAGLFLLCIDPKDMGEVNKGDLLAVACAAVFAVHILMIERFAAVSDGLRLSAVQFFVGGILSCAAMFIFEHPSLDGIFNAAAPLLYAGIMSCGVAYTLQIIGQKYTEATVASLLLCMESVFGVIAATIILGERLKGREIAGCIIMFSAIILSQFSQRLTKMQANKKTA